MLIVAGDYSLFMYEGTEQFNLPQLLIPHPDYSGENNNDIMLIKVRTIGQETVLMQNMSGKINVSICCCCCCCYK